MPVIYRQPLPAIHAAPSAGKSCLIRTAALVVIMAQLGSFVPADSALLHVFDGVFTRMGASDNLLMGRRYLLCVFCERAHLCVTIGCRGALPSLRVGVWGRVCVWVHRQACYMFRPEPLLQDSGPPGSSLGLGRDIKTKCHQL